MQAAAPSASAAAAPAARLGGTVVAALFLIELAALGGRARLAPLRVEAILAY